MNHNLLSMDKTVFSEEFWCFIKKIVSFDLPILFFSVILFLMSADLSIMIN